MFVEVTTAIARGRVAIAVGEIVEVKDLTAYPSRDLERFGRTRIAIRGKRRIHMDVVESYDVVMGMVAAAAGGACPPVAGRGASGELPDASPATPGPG